MNQDLEASVREELATALFNTPRQTHVNPGKPVCPVIADIEWPEDCKQLPKLSSFVTSCS